MKRKKPTYVTKKKSSVSLRDAWARRDPAEWEPHPDDELPWEWAPKHHIVTATSIIDEH